MRAVELVGANARSHSVFADSAPPRPGLNRANPDTGCVEPAGALECASFLFKAGP